MRPSILIWPILGCCSFSLLQLIATSSPHPPCCCSVPFTPEPSALREERVHKELISSQAQTAPVNDCSQNLNSTGSMGTVLGGTNLLLPAVTHCWLLPTPACHPGQDAHSCLPLLPTTLVGCGVPPLDPQTESGI
jgi:hypothetical protein